jgi:hypothetical protein
MKTDFAMSFLNIVSADLDVNIDRLNIHDLPGKRDLRDLLQEKHVRLNKH